MITRINLLAYYIFKGFFGIFILFCSFKIQFMVFASVSDACFPLTLQEARITDTIQVVLKRFL